MEKHGKFGFIKLFTGAFFLPNFKPNVCTSTATVSTGIDKATMDMVIRMDIQWDVADGSFIPGERTQCKETWMTGVYSITTDWIMYMKLLMTIMSPPVLEKAAPEYYKVNTDMPMPNERSMKHRKVSDVALTSTQQFNNRTQVKANIYRTAFLSLVVYIHDRSGACIVDKYPLRV